MDPLSKRLLDEFQRDFPLVSRPYAALAESLGTTEEDVLDRLRGLQEAGSISRIGPVFRPNRVGASTLAALSVERDRLDEVAALVSRHAGVNHNYEREHDLNLWFVVTASDAERLAEILREIEAETGCEVLPLPLLEEYHIDLGFGLWR